MKGQELTMPEILSESAIFSDHLTAHPERAVIDDHQVRAFPPKTAAHKASPAFIRMPHLSLVKNTGEGKHAGGRDSSAGVLC